MPLPGNYSILKFTGIQSWFGNIVIIDEAQLQTSFYDEHPVKSVVAY